MATDPASTEACADTSIWISIILEEADYGARMDALGEPEVLWIAAPVLVEALLVLERRRIPDGVANLERLLRGSSAQILPFDAVQARMAHEAFQKYGKGRHPAALNFGDCLSYAAAKAKGARLLYVGEDSAQTDLG